MKVIVTGGAGFIGSWVIRVLLAETNAHVINLDKMTYAANPDILIEFANNPRHTFVKGDICDRRFLASLFDQYQPDLILHLAAESHVDRSIDGPHIFVETNIVGTATLIDVALQYWRKLSGEARDRFRFHHISTDEVYGALGDEGQFTEETPYNPSSPYSASKASSDHLVRAWHHTFGLPVLITNCSNNYGPYQFPEKLIPLMIAHAVHEKPLPVYGTGKNVRDWLYVEDHARALWCVATQGRIGETYNIGGDGEASNLSIVEQICDYVDEVSPRGNVSPRRDLITFVADRPGHDFRYAIDCTKIKRELGWSPRQTLESGLKSTVDWYLSNQSWWTDILENRYNGIRLGQTEKRAA